MHKGCSPAPVVPVVQYFALCGLSRSASAHRKCGGCRQVQSHVVLGPLPFENMSTLLHNLCDHQ